MTDKEVIQALRLCSCEAGTRNCPTCPLSGNEDCVTDALGEAADIIERLTAEGADLRKELERKYVVIALAQRKQTEAEAERDALLEKKRWILVSKKEPEYDMPQLAMTSDGEVLIANYAYGEWFDTWGQDVDVTHWMPLPEAPEEGE